MIKYTFRRRNYNRIPEIGENIEATAKERERERESLYEIHRHTVCGFYKINVDIVRIP